MLIDGFACRLQNMHMLSSDLRVVWEVSEALSVRKAVQLAFVRLWHAKMIGDSLGQVLVTRASDKQEVVLVLDRRAPL